MKLQTATRKRAKIKMALQGPSGSGKTYSSLLIAYGLTSNWENIAVIDTENHSAELYAHLGPYKVLSLSAPYSPERYTEAIDTCVKAGMEVVIIDSITHEWENLIDFHASMAGNSFTNWAKVTPRHNAFVQKLLQTPIHVISTVRTKQDYVLNEKNGRMVPEKVGLKSVQRDGLDYEMTLVFDLDMKNSATASKDRTGLFVGKPAETLSAETGKLIQQWCSTSEQIEVDEVSERIGSCLSMEELLTLYNMFPQYQEVLNAEFKRRKRELIMSPSPSLNGVLHTENH
jgi:AAA domain